MSKERNVTLVAFLFTIAIFVLGYISFGFWTMLVLTSGFLGGFILWLIVPTNVSFATIKIPYIAAFILFALHRAEEKVMDFFPTLSSITGVSTPEIVSPQIILLVAASVGAWLFIPYLMNRGYQLGTYFAWTFFAALGITELAHFLVFPFFTGEPYGYFPGMASVILLAPVAWWGMWRLGRRAN